METYEAMRHFADSWGLLAMMLFFIAVVVRVFTPRGRAAAADAASIPFTETDALPEPGRHDEALAARAPWGEERRNG